MSSLTYRFITANDKEGYRDILMDPEVTLPAGYLPAENEIEFEFLFQRMILNKVVSIFLGETIIGYMTIYPDQLESDKDKKAVGIGFAFKKAYWHQGYGYEMLSYFSKYLKTKVDYVICDAFVENEASNRLIQKCGFQHLEDYTMYFEGLQQNKRCHSYIK